MGIGEALVLGLSIVGLGGTITGFAIKSARDVTAGITRTTSEIHAVNEQLSKTYDEHVRTRVTMEKLRDDNSESRREIWRELNAMGKIVAKLEGKVLNGQH